MCMAEGVAVKPVDGRRFADNHTVVTNLIQRVITDNLRDVVLEPNSDALLKRIAYRLTLVLADMISIVDTISVHCDLLNESSEIHVTIEGEFIDGEREMAVTKNFISTIWKEATAGGDSCQIDR